MNGSSEFSSSLFAAHSTPSTIPPLPPDIYDYHVGWICQSTEDYGAVCKIIDAEHKLPIIPLKPSSRTFYKLARIGRHNVVINIPSRDSTAESLPLNVARGLVSQFPLIRFFLMVGSSGTANSTDGSAKMGDVVIGTKVIPCSTTHNKMKRKINDDILQLPGYLSTALTVLFYERDFNGSVLQQRMDEIVRRFPSHNGRYERPSNSRLNSTKGHFGQSPESPHHGSTIENRHSHLSRSIEVFQGTVASTVEKKDSDRIGIQEQKSLPDDILCVEHGSAEILAAGISCLPILGISRDARDESIQQSDWSHYSAFAAAVCSKEVLASITPEVVAQALSTMSSKDVEIMMKENVKFMNRVIQEACRLGQPDRILQAAQIAEKRIDELEVWMQNLSDSVQQHANQQLINVQTEMENIKNTEETMQHDMEVMQNKIEVLMKDPSNAQIQEELTVLRDTVRDHSSRLEVLTEFTTGVAQIAEDVLQKVAQDTGNKDVEIARQWLIFVTSYRGLLEKFGSKKNVKSTPLAVKAAPQNLRHDENSSPSEKGSAPKTKFGSNLFEKLRPNKPSAPKGSCEIPADGMEDRPGRTKPGPRINITPLPSPMSSSTLSMTRTQSSHSLDSATSRSSNSPRKEMEGPTQRQTNSRVPLIRHATDLKMGNWPANQSARQKPRLPPRTPEMSVGSANKSEVDKESLSNVQRLKAKYDQGNGMIRPATPQREGTHWQRGNNSYI